MISAGRRIIVVNQMFGGVLDRAVASYRGVCVLTFLSFLVTASVVPCFGQGDDWKRKNDRGNRWEGTIQLPVSQPDLVLLSLTSFRQKVEDDTELKVRFFLPGGTEARVEARELQENVHYWMESKPIEAQETGWQVFGPWPVSEVLSRNSVSFTNIGVLVRLRSEGGGEKHLAPAMIYDSERPKTAGRYTFLFRPSIPLRSLEYTAYLVGDETEKVASASLAGNKARGVPFPIELDLSEVPAGLVRLEIRGRYRSRTGGPVREYEFHHQFLE